MELFLLPVFNVLIYATYLTYNLFTKLMRLSIYDMENIQYQTKLTLLLDCNLKDIDKKENILENFLSWLRLERVSNKRKDGSNRRKDNRVLNQV